MNIAIVGGGFTGLTAAYELAKKGHKVTVFEKDRVLGGLAAGFRRPGWNWHLEKAYHHLFTNDRAILSLIDELGLSDKLVITRPITATYWRGGIYPFDSLSSLLSFPGIGVIDRLRTGALLASIKLNPFWQPFEWITAKQLFLTVGGRAAWKTIWEPLMTGKFGPYADRVAASWLWARIKKRTPRLAYIKGGFHTLVAALEQAIGEHGSIIKKNYPYNTFSRGAFDRLLLTIPTPTATTLVPHWKLEIGNWSLNIPHLHAQTLILETNEPILQGVYWLNVTDRSFPFLAVVAHTNMIDKKHYGGRHITYFSNYLPDGHPYLSMTAEQLYREFLPFIKRLSITANGKMKTVNFFQNRLPFTVYRLHLFTGLYAQPVHELHYSRRAPRFETRIPNVYLANMDSVYPWDRGTNYAVELGKHAAYAIHKSNE